MCTRADESRSNGPVASETSERMLPRDPLMQGAKGDDSFCAESVDDAACSGEPDTSQQIAGLGKDPRAGIPGAVRDETGVVTGRLSEEPSPRPFTWRETDRRQRSASGESSLWGDLPVHGGPAWFAVGSSRSARSPLGRAGRDLRRSAITRLRERCAGGWQTCGPGDSSSSTQPSTIGLSSFLPRGCQPPLHSGRGENITNSDKRFDRISKPTFVGGWRVAEHSDVPDRRSAGASLRSATGYPSS